MTTGCYLYAVFSILNCGFLGYVTANTSKALLSNHPAWKTLNSFECGESAADRIIGGTKAALGQFPWIARLGYTFPDDPEIDWMCGGALLTDRSIITAAHCISSEEDQYTLKYIRLGEHNIRSDPDCELSICAPAVQDIGIKNITKHPSFNIPLFHNDIALIELQTPAQLNDYVVPICLPQNDEQQADIRIGELVQAAGWGKMNMTTEERANVLQVVAVPIVEPNMCDLFGKEFKIEKSELCAGAQSNKDACGGDSGGPLMKVFNTDEGPKSFLVGVVSFGPTVCGIKKPGVYTSITFFLSWILDNIV